ncbi:hypothetical protein ACJRO7_026632 [Eucalyptus globulus]|uniref:Uncharacterized protein n=1 Tax=Eucalyptus globulus TaxID=34317 RepID=A0ABD3JYW5_EUCGL
MEIALFKGNTNPSGARCSLLIVKWCPNLCIDHLCQKTCDSYIRPIKKPRMTMLTNDPEEDDAMFSSRFLCDVFLSFHGADTPPPWHCGSPLPRARAQQRAVALAQRRRPRVRGGDSAGPSGGD